jgi:hypothetical protein
MPPFRSIDAIENYLLFIVARAVFKISASSALCLSAGIAVSVLWPNYQATARVKK